MTKAIELVEQAESWLGYNEADGMYKVIIDVYNSYTPHPRGYTLQYSDSWCAAFCSALAIKCNATDIVPIECSCPQWISLAQSMGIWCEDDSYTPSVGDFVLYDWQDSGSGDNTGTPDHIGIIKAVGPTTFTVIEGNKSDAVGYRTMSINGQYIRGFVCPNYDGQSSSTLETTTTSNATPVTVLGTLEVDGLWGCATTTALQNYFGTEADGIVSHQYSAYKTSNPGLLSSTFQWESSPSGYSPLIKAMQVKLGVTQDGYIGPNTIKALQNRYGTGTDGVISSPSPCVKVMQTKLNQGEFQMDEQKYRSNVVYEAHDKIKTIIMKGKITTNEAQVFLDKLYGVNSACVLRINIEDIS